MQSIVVHYKELALKGRNRPWFARMLVRNLRAALGGLDIGAVRHAMGRLEIDLTPSSPRQEVIDRVARIFGIANFSVASRGPQDVNALGSAILQELGAETLGAKPLASFRISARRSDKRFPLTSPQIERALGAVVQASTGWRVDLEHPDLEIHVDMLTGVAFYYFEKRPGAGGLPTGTGGRVACLLSGGIDSPVAAYRMMRRGCSVLLVHFHSYPILSHASQEKVREIAALLTKHQLRSRLLLVPFGDLQQQVVVTVPPDLRVVIYRRLMMRIAERLARAWRARALVTGEVVGQVASQTIENLATIGEAASLEVLRPLVGMDKDEIVAEAVRIGTYPISIIPDQDCCQLFTPRHPATRARIEVVRAAEEALPIEEMVASACDAVAVEDFRFPMVKLSAGRSV
jgi:thiamine biosynthesis protein ThiI